MKTFYFLLLISTGLILPHILDAQEMSSFQYAHSKNPQNFFDLQDAMNEYFALYPGIKGENPWRRKEWYLEQRLFPTGEYFDLAGHTQSEYARYLKKNSTHRSTHGGWLFIGPLEETFVNAAGGNWGQGRVNSIDFHPTDTNTLFITTPNAGIWKTSNGGSSWANISPNLPLLSTTDLEVDHTNPNVIYALTGDGDPGAGELVSHAGTEVSSTGIIKTTDGGLTWHPTEFNFTHPSNKIPHKLIMHPSNPQIQFACFQNGLYRTDDGWNTSTFEISEWIYDIEFHPTDPSIVYASGQTYFFSSFDTGLGWSFRWDSDFSILPGTVRTEIAVSEDAPNMVYLLGYGWNGTKISLFQSANFGNANTWIVKDTVSDIVGPQADYDMAMAVKTSDSSTVIAGGINFARSNSQGSPGSWTFVGFSWPCHPDVHELKYRGNTLYAATDGGIHRSYDDGATWTDLSNGLAITEVYRISGTPQNTNKYIIGAQDVGTKMRPGVTTTFAQIGGADGMVSAIDYTNENILYVSGQYGGFHKSTDGGATTSALSIPGGGGAWITPFIMDPVDPDIIFVGKDKIYRSLSGGTLWLGLNSPTIGWRFNCLAQGKNDRNKMYATFSNQIWRSDNILDLPTNVTWTEITSGLPSLFITDVAVDANDATTVYVTVSGYEGGNKVYRNNSGNPGAWVNISGSLPNVPANCIEFHDNGQNGLYVGTDIGVFYRDNTLSDWIYFSNFLPSVNVSDLYLNPTNNTIAAGTYGRGLWLSSTYSACVANVNLTASSVDGGNQHYSASNTITSTNDYDKDMGTLINYKAGNYIELKPGFELGGHAFFEGKIGGCPAGIAMPMIQNVFPSGTYLASGSKFDANPN